MTETSKQPRTTGLFLHPLLMLILSGTGLSISLVLGVLFLVGGGIGLVNRNLPSGLLPFFSMGWTALLVGGMLLFPLVQSVQQLTGKETHHAQKSHLRTASILMVIWVPLMLLGNWIAKGQFLAWLFLPLLQLFLVAVPIFFLIELSRRKLQHPEGGGWGVYSIGVLLTQPVVILIELFSLIGLAIVAIGWISTQPGLVDEIARLSQRLTDAQLDPQVVEQIMLPYLQQPVVVLVLMAIGAGLIPLLEEFMKPLALWIMVGRKLDEPAGFVLGLFAGGTFALLESLGMAASATGQDWSSVIIARLGTGVLHITTTALMGWGLAAAWTNRKYVRLGLTYLFSFTLHSVWNLMGLYLGIEQFLPANARFLPKTVASAVLIVLAVGMVVILLVANRYLRTKQAARSPGIPETLNRTGYTVKNTDEKNDGLETVKDGSD